MANLTKYIPAWRVRLCMAFALLVLCVIIWIPTIWSGKNLLHELPPCAQQHAAFLLCTLAAILCLRGRRGTPIRWGIGLVLSACCLVLGYQWERAFRVANRIIFPHYSTWAADAQADVIYTLPCNDRLVVLTFDDGPQREKTEALLDILKQEDVHATFFIRGEYIAGNEDILQRERAEGHDLGNHSWSHPFCPVHLPGFVKEDFERCSNAIEAAAGVRPSLCRFPYGGSRPGLAKTLHEECGMTAVFWNVTSQDWRHDGDAIACRRVLGSLPATGAAIVLNHDHGLSPAGLQRIIRDLKQQGWRFLSVSELQTICGQEAHEPSVSSFSPQDAHHHTNI